MKFKLNLLEDYVNFVDTTNKKTHKLKQTYF